MHGVSPGPPRPRHGVSPGPPRPRGRIARRRSPSHWTYLGDSGNTARRRSRRRGPDKNARTGPGPGGPGPAVRPARWGRRLCGARRWTSQRPPWGEQVDGMPGGTGQGEVGEDLTDDGDELEAVPGESAGDGDRSGWAGWRAMTKCSSGVLEYMQVAADRKVPGRAGRNLLVCRPWPATSWSWTVRSMVSGVQGVPLPEERDLRAAVRPVDGRETVDLDAGRVLPDVDGMPFGGVRAGAAGGLEPVHDLALHPHRHTEVGEQLRGPGARADRPAGPRCSVPARCAPARRRRTASQRITGSSKRRSAPCAGGELEVGGDGPLGPQQPGRAS